MRRLHLILFISALVHVTAVTARANLFDYQGYAWETGGFPPSVSGDSLRIPFVVNALLPDLGVDLTATEMTGFITGLVSEGAQDLGGGTHSIQYSAGTIEIYRDSARDHDFGEFPPNGTVPSTFANGTLCLRGSIEHFVLFFDDSTSTGAYQGDVLFADGDCLTQLAALRGEGFTFAGILARGAGGANLPKGYDLQVDGAIDATFVPIARCDRFECMSITDVTFGFPKKAPKKFGSKDGCFHIDGEFTPCSDFDLSQVPVRVRIGSYEQVLPPGSLHRILLPQDADEEWKFRDPNGKATLTEVELERDGGPWRFEISGRGLTRQQLLGSGLNLELRLAIGDQAGSDQALLTQRRKDIVLGGCHERHPCGRDDDIRAKKGALASAMSPSGARYEVFPASPNPFNPTTTIAVRTSMPSLVRLDIFDVRGRQVRALQRGALPSGEHRFTWNGTDDRGQRVASGIYLYRLQAPGFAETRKLVLAK